MGKLDDAVKLIFRSPVPTDPSFYLKLLELCIDARAEKPGRVKGNQFTYGSALRACTKLMCLRSGKQIQGCLQKRRFAGDLFVQSALVDLHAKCGDIKDASCVFEMMSERDLVCWNAMIGGYSAQGFSNDALRTFRSMLRSMVVKDIMSYTAMIAGFACESDHYADALNLFIETYGSGMLLDGFLLCTVLNICGNSPSLNLGRQIHALVVKYVFTYDVAIGNALIDMYAKCGELEEANHAFNQMPEKNVISWSSLIDGYAKHGDGQKAMALYRLMESEGLMPNDITFLSLLFACSHAGLESEAWECFGNMTGRYNIAPASKHYSCMVDLLARGGQLEEAFNLTQKMKVLPNASLWGGILGGSCLYGDASLANRAANLLSDLGIANSSNYVALANAYAAAGLWGDSLTIHKLMEQYNLKKNPGHSLLFFGG
ncbi:hypothetical protein Cgig2_004395 [Carnegiea gigantea]|uniref:Pentatricopeptide repeat-containing protein n=1 Tax=Carnegiea gigantea TaxID=171969 RepID=A0A9Q1Q675_9CARY|nr:hypothetical protein Cgig2_004395 [Carnegiea gigantea]